MLLRIHPNTIYSPKPPARWSAGCAAAKPPSRFLAPWPHREVYNAVSHVETVLSISFVGPSAPQRCTIPCEPLVRAHAAKRDWAISPHLLADIPAFIVTVFVVIILFSPLVHPILVSFHELVVVSFLYRRVVLVGSIIIDLVAGEWP